MEPLNLAVICNKDNGSPKVLGETLNEFIKSTGNKSNLFYQNKALRRLVPLTKVKLNKIAWVFYKIINYFNDKKLFNELKKADAIIICSTSPYAFYGDSFDTNRLKQIVGNKPILYYAVQYLLNSPSLIERLQNGDNAGIERFDWHLTVSDITELRGKQESPWTRIGMYLKSTSLKPVKKKEFFAVVDFVREGFEHYREEQIQALEELDIPYLSLEKTYSLEDIREIYKRASLFFIQFHEAYGLPIAECLASGTYIFTPDSSWPMAWRLDEEVAVHGPGTLPNCFVVYNGVEDLKRSLSEMQSTYDINETPQKVFNTFTDSYPHYYHGDEKALHNVFDLIRNKKITT